MPTAPHPRTANPFERNGPGFRPLTKVVLLALRPDGRVALVRRAAGPEHGQRGELALVGGRLEPAEWLDEAACRGASQTLGIRVGVQDVELSGLLHYRNERGAGRLCAIFATQRWSGEPRNCVPGEYSELVWADPGGPPTDCRPLTHLVLDQYVSGVLYAAAAMPKAMPSASGGTESTAVGQGPGSDVEAFNPAMATPTSENSTGAHPQTRGMK